MSRRRFLIALEERRVSRFQRLCCLFNSSAFGLFGLSLINFNCSKNSFLMCALLFPISRESGSGTPQPDKRFVFSDTLLTSMGNEKGTFHTAVEIRRERYPPNPPTNRWFETFSIVRAILKTKIVPYHFHSWKDKKITMHIFEIVRRLGFQTDNGWSSIPCHKTPQKN